MKLFCCLLVLLWLPSAAVAQAVEGTVRAEGEPVPMASIRLVGIGTGTAAGADGRFRLVLPGPGRYTLAISSVGFESAEFSVTAADGQTVNLPVFLTAATYEAGVVVVTGTMQDLGIRESPVKVDVLPARFMELTPSVNIMDAVERVNGLYQQIDCGVCYTNNVRINGIDGPNTAVLIDGMPVMSSLAAAYGLNGISPILVQQIEVVKGPMSTLYGSAALGGIINIRTKNPATAPRLATHVYSTNHAEMAAEFAAVPLRSHSANSLVSATLLRANTYHDNNKDGFSDRPLETRLGVFAKAEFLDAHRFARGSLAAKLYYEDRAAGVEPFLRDVRRFRGSSSLYGETIHTRRAEIIGSLALRPDLKLHASASMHDQDSHYGLSRYEARQADAFGQLLWTPATEGTTLDEHNLLIGLAMRSMRYDDSSGATGEYNDSGELSVNQPDLRTAPGLFIQDDWQVRSSLRLLTGLRADFQSGHGLIASPRAAVKWQPTDLLTVRLNMGTGFRRVNLFTEDHAAYTGGRATVILEDLAPERSISTTLGLRQFITGVGDPVTVDLDMFWTRFSNKIEPDYSVPGQIQYTNLNGYAVSRGIAFQLQGSAGRTLRYSAGFTLLNVYSQSGEQRQPLEFAPDYMGTMVLMWEIPGRVVINYTGRLTGPMAMPQYSLQTRQQYRAATGANLWVKSPPYSVHNIQLTRDFVFGPRLLQTYITAENVLGYRQSSPIVGFYDGIPGFGDSFDTAYVYGPIEGRHFGAGLRIILP